MQNSTNNKESNFEELISMKGNFIYKIHYHKKKNIKKNPRLKKKSSGWDKIRDQLELNSESICNFGSS